MNAQRFLSIPPVIEQMERQVTLSEASHHAVLSSLDLLPIAVLVLDQQGKILVANKTANELIRLGRTIAVVDNALAIESVLHNKTLRQLINSSGHRIVGGLVVPRAALKPLAILVVPVPHNGKPGYPASLVFVTDPELPCVADTALLARLFGFTPAESRVAALVMRGKAVGDIAEELGITAHTTRNHLKRLFSKTHTNKQGELVHALLSSPAFLCLKVAES
jgi:DNA-binding CsgD family transcriptional regulator